MATKTGSWARTVVFIALALVTAAVVFTFAPGVERGQPGLQVAARPDTPIIITTRAGTADAEALVKQLGGKVTHRLPIIGSLSAVVPADAVPVIEAAPSIARVSLDAAFKGSLALPMPPKPSNNATDQSFFLYTIKADHLRDKKDTQGRPLDGTGVGVAVVDSGITTSTGNGAPDLNVVAAESFSPDGDGSTTDQNGHGTYVAGIIDNSGSTSGGAFRGVAPGSNLIDLKVTDSRGMANEADVVSALQWVYDNHDKYNIRVVNLSLNCDSMQSPDQSPLDAACEVLWFNKIVVVTSAGNVMTPGVQTISSPPANDPFVITVGASDEHLTSDVGKHTIPDWSARGITPQGFVKPEIYAPGTNIYSLVAPTFSLGNLAGRTVRGGQIVRMSGTSAAAPMVSAAATILLQKDPTLNPDQVKWRLANASGQLKTRENNKDVNKPYLDLDKAVGSGDNKTANTGIAASELLKTGDQPTSWASNMWDSVMWRSVMWRSVMWRSVMWRSVMWRSLTYDSVQTTSTP